ncbi:PREDICTED: titin-like [Ceratosolen solmsi marchali]|uniref:Titin n=1 Tax=Ceratosolen solmsi marchali TaxID=326594 RepID=A0AAJ6YDK6_9HYME|nr:PREDICTED: titin-like [Ceratosolen solmsi marchali]
MTPITFINEVPEEEVIFYETTGLLPELQYGIPKEVEQVTKTVTVVHELTPTGNDKKTTKERVTKRKGNKQTVTEIITIDEMDKLPLCFVNEVPEEEVIFDETTGVLATLEYGRPKEIETVKEEITLVHEIMPAEKEKKTTKKRITTRKGSKQSVIEIVKIEEAGEAPKIIINEIPDEEVIFEETTGLLPMTEFCKPIASEEIKEQVLVMQDVTSEGKDRKTIKKKAIKQKGRRKSVIETIIIHEEGKKPISFVHETPVEEVIFDETTGVLPSTVYVKPTETAEIKEQITVVHETTPEGKEKKTTKKRITKRKGRKQSVTEIIKIEEDGKIPITFINEVPEEVIIFSESTGVLPVTESAQAEQPVEVSKQVTLTQGVTQEGKEQRTLKKRTTKRIGPKQSVTELVTVEVAGKPPKTFVKEAPEEEIVFDERTELIPVTEYNKPEQTAEISEQITILLEKIPEGTDKKTTKKRVTKRKGRKQSVTEMVTIEEHGKHPISFINEVPEEEIIFTETTGLLPVTEYAKSRETAEIMKQTIIMQEITQEKKHKQTVKQIVKKRKGPKESLSEVVTIEEEGTEAPIIIVNEVPNEEIIFDEITELIPVTKDDKIKEHVEVSELITVSQEITPEGQDKKITKKRITRRRGPKQSITEIIKIEEEGKEPIISKQEVPEELIIHEESTDLLPITESQKPEELEQIKEQIMITQELTPEEKNITTTKKRIVKRKGPKQSVTEIITVKEADKIPITLINNFPEEEIIYDEKTLIIPTNDEDIDINVTRKKSKKKKPVKKKADYEEWVEPEYTPAVLEPMPEKIQWDTKKPKDKQKRTPELQKLVPMKIERKEIKPIKLKITEPTEVAQYPGMKLKKVTIPKRKESKAVKVPKIRLKSRIILISDWPTPLQIPILTILEENPLQSGILSRNIDEAEKILKKKYKKKKLPGKDIIDLEELDKEFDDLKKKPLEKVDDLMPYEKRKKTPKDQPSEEDKKLKLGKGKIPKDDSVPEDIHLKKVPEKKEKSVDKKEKKPKLIDEPMDVDKEKEDKPETTIQPLNFKPSDVDNVDLEKYEPEEKEKPTDESPERPREKYKRPDKKKKDQEIDHIPILKGEPKPKKLEDDTDVKFRVPVQDKPDEIPEEITLKPWQKQNESTLLKIEDTKFEGLDKTISPSENDSVNKLNYTQDISQPLYKTPKHRKLPIQDENKTYEGEFDTIKNDVSLKICCCFYGLEFFNLIIHLLDIQLPKEDIKESDNISPTKKLKKKKPKTNDTVELKEKHATQSNENQIPDIFEDIHEIKPVTDKANEEVSLVESMNDMGPLVETLSQDISADKLCIETKQQGQIVDANSGIRESTDATEVFPEITVTEINDSMIGDQIVENIKVAFKIEQSVLPEELSKNIIENTEKKIDTEIYLDDQIKNVKEVLTPTLESPHSVTKDESEYAPQTSNITDEIKAKDGIEKKKKKPVKKKADYEEWVEPEYTPAVLEPMPEKIQWDTKKPKDKQKRTPELQKLVTIPKRKESKAVKVPKIRLKSRIILISDWPTPLQIPILTILEENPLQSGILSRNIDEAEKILKKKYKKKKLPGKDIIDLEELDKEFDDLKKKPLEKVDDLMPYEKRKKTPKDQPSEEDKKLKLGKGKIPKDDSVPEDIHLKKVPEKKEKSVDKKEKKPKLIDEPMDVDKEKEDKPETTIQPLNFKPSDVDNVDLEKYEPEEKEKPTDESPERPREKYKRPDKKKKDQEIDHIPILKGEPKPKKLEDDTDVKFRVPVQDKPDEIPEEILLKPWTKEKPMHEEKMDIDEQIGLQPLDQKQDANTDNIKMPLQKKKKQKIVNELNKDMLYDKPEDNTSSPITAAEICNEQIEKYEKIKPGILEIPKNVPDIILADITEQQISKIGKKKKKPVKKKADYEEWVEPEYTPAVLEPMPEKIQWDTKKPKDKQKRTPELQKLVTIPKRKESKAVKVPKIRLKSRIILISDWPTPLQIPILTILEENPLQSGILSRNIDEAEKILKKKYKKKKLPGKDIIDLEELDKEFDDLKKKPLEKVDDLMPYEKRKKTPKDQPSEEDKKLKLGKGKIPKDDSVPEDIHLKKVPEKKEKSVDKKEKKPKLIDEPMDVDKEKEDKPETTIQPLNFKPSDVDNVDLEKYEPEEKEKPTDESPERPREKYKRPDKKKKDQEIDHIPILKGEPKPKKLEDDTDVKFRVPVQDKPDEIPEEILLKPSANETAAKTENDIISRQDDIIKKEKPIKKCKQPLEPDEIDELIDLAKLEESDKTTIVTPTDIVNVEKPEDINNDTLLNEKLKSKVKVEETLEELTIVKPVPQDEDKEEKEIPLEKEIVDVEIIEEVAIKRKPEKKPSIDETPEEDTIHKQAELVEVKKSDDVQTSIPLKKKPKKKVKVEETVEELTIVKPEIIDDVRIKRRPEKKPSIDEFVEEITVTKPKEDDTTVPKSEDVVVELPLKKKENIVADDSADEITIQKLIPLKKEIVDEEIIEEVAIKPKPKKKPSIDETPEEVTIHKQVELDQVKQPEDVETSMPVKKKPKKKVKVDETVEELTIKKPIPLEDVTDNVEEYTLKRKPPKMLPKPIEEIYEDVTIKKLRSRKKPRSDLPEVTETETVTFKPRKITTKEEVEQEFKISLNTYEEENISLSGKVKIKPRKKKPTYSEEAGEETIQIIQEFDNSVPVVEEIIDESEDEYSIKEHETNELNLPLKRKSVDKCQSYAIEDIEDDVRLPLKSNQKYLCENTDESIEIKLKPKRRVSTLEEGEATLSLLKEDNISEEEYIVQDGDTMYSVCSYVAETNEAINLIEGEKVLVIEHTNSDWWFVKKNLTQEKGWVPAQYLLDEIQYSLYLQRKLHEKIDKLPVFEKPAIGDETSAPRFIEKLQPIHTPDGYTVQFECQVKGVPRPQITWFRQTAIIKPSPDFQMFYDDDNVATLIIKEVFPEDAGTFTCVAKNTVGFASSTTELIVEIPGSDHGSDVTILSRKSLSRESSLADILEGIPPTFSRQPKAKCVQEGDNVILECRLVAVPEPEITWLYNNKKLSNQENMIITTESDMHMYCSIMKITKVLKTQEGKYTIVAKNREGEATIEIPLKVQTTNKEPPEILEPLKPFAVREGDTVVLSTHIVGNPQPLISWLKNGQPLCEMIPKKDGNLNTLTFIQSVISDSGEYSVVAKNELGTAETKATLTVEEIPSGAPEPPLFTERFQELTVPERGNFKLVAKVTGNPIPEVTWLRNNRPLEKSSDVTEIYDGENIVLEIRNANSETDAGDYKCVAINPVGKTSHGAKVTVDVDKVIFIKKLEKRKTIDEYKSLELICETSHTVSTTWWHNDKEISGMDHREVIEEGKIHKLVIKRVTQGDEGNYKCIVKNQTTFCNVKVNATKPEFVKKLQDFEVIERNSAILEVEITSQTADVSWFKDGIELFPSSEKLEFIKEGTVRKLLIRSSSIQDEGEYTCFLSDQKCTAEVTVVELPPEIITKMQNVTIVKGEKAIFEIELTKGDALVQWFKDDQELKFSEHIQLSIDGKRQKLKIYNSELDDEGIYSCRVGKQISIAKLTIEEPEVEFVKRLPEVTLISLNEDAIFEIQLSKPDIPVTWLRKGQEIHDSPKYTIIDERFKKKLIVKNCTIEDALEYSVTATNVKCSSKLKVKVIEAPPIISMNSPNIYRVKAGDDIEMNVNFTAAPKPTDEWTVNGNLIQKSKRIIQTLNDEFAALTIRKVQKSDIGDYTLKVTNVHGDATINIKLIVMQIPNAPDTPEAIDVTNDSVTLQWNEPEFDGNSPIIEYILEYREKEAITWTKVLEIITTTEHTVNKLITGREYVFRIIAVNLIGPSEPSTNSKLIKIMDASQLPQNEPGSPRGPLEISGMTATSFTIKWETPEDDGGSPITEYIIEMKETSMKSWKKVGTTKGDITHVGVSDLITDTPYDFRITAKNKIGLGLPFVSKEPITSGKILKITKISESRIYALLGSFPETKIINYKTPPSPPTNVHVTNITTRSVTLNWSPPTSTGGADLTGYIIEKRPLTGKGSKWTKVVTLDGTINSHVIENLKENEFLFRVFAENNIGLSAATTSEPVLLKSHAIPSPPTAPLEIRQIAGNTIAMEWGRPEFDGGAPLEAYKIAVRDVKKTMWMEVGRVNAGIQKLTIRDLQENHEYLFRIYAKNEIGCSEPLESEEPFKILPASDLAVIEPVAEVPDRGETTSLSFSTENTSSWLRDHNMDADIHSYARARLLRKDEYFFRIWLNAKKLFK